MSETPKPKKSKRRFALKVSGRLLALLVLVVVVGYSILVVSSCQSAGARAEGKRLERMKTSKQWHGDAFANELVAEEAGFFEMISGTSASVEGETPSKALNIKRRTLADFAVAPASGLRVTWLGHSTFIVEIDGRRVLVDPVWGERTSPVTWVGPSRFHEPPLPLDQLPHIDAVVISHDHYDHLDFETVRKMLDLETQWIVPLGIGAHLEHWGVKKSRIVELDWWEDTLIGEDSSALKITCTPARHFSGRSVTFTDQNATLWSSWALTGPEHRVFYSGDSALHPDFKTIGERLGPFDVTMMETGAADKLWRDVHMGPEQAVIAHQLVKGKLMLPVHWGTFALGNHSWTQPMQRVLAAAKKVGVKVIAPRPGGMFEPADGPAVDAWWDAENPWENAQSQPKWSSSVDAILESSPLFSSAP